MLCCEDAIFPQFKNHLFRSLSLCSVIVVFKLLDNNILLQDKYYLSSVAKLYSSSLGLSV